MKTHNHLAFASLAVLGREGMDSTNARWNPAWLIVALVTGLWSLSFAGPGSSFSPAQGEAAVAQIKERGLYDSLQEAVARAHYEVYPEPQRLASWQAGNPAQQMRARFMAEGVQVEAKPGDRASQRIGMKLRSVGYGERAMGVSAAGLTTSGNRIEYRRSLVGDDDSAAGAITEWYVNTAAGLEQGFTLESAPGERRDGERLRVVLALEGDLRAQPVDGGQALEFKDSAGQRVLRYDHLVVWDAGGRELEARMEVRTEGGEDQVWLEVDDRDAVWPVTIDPTFTQQAKLQAADATAGDAFGASVAISGETVVVGARPASYVFVRSGATWRQQQRLGASGDSVAISGETIVVGAPSYNGAGGPSQGAAYVFVRNGEVWSQQQQLLAADAASNDRFGTSVAVSGETVVVGAPSGGAGGLRQGAGYVFVRSGEVWRQQDKLQAADAAAFDLFGTSVAISGEAIVVGARSYSGAGRPRQGAAYVFVRDGEVWRQQQQLLAWDAVAGDEFGLSVAISGETVVVGKLGPQFSGTGERQGAAYVFVRSGEAWRQQQKLQIAELTNFGTSVAISGETIVVGAPFDSHATPTLSFFSQGAAYVFARSGEVWSQQQKLHAAVKSGASSRNSWQRTREHSASSAPRWRSAGGRWWSARRCA
jgi:FG-GAP repeat